MNDPKKSPEEIIEFIKSVITNLVDQADNATIEGTSLAGEIIVIVRAPYNACAKLIGKEHRMRHSLITVLNGICRKNGYFFQFQIRDNENKIQADDVKDGGEAYPRVKSRYDQTHSSGRPYKRGAPRGA